MGLDGGSQKHESLSTRNRMGKVKPQSTVIVSDLICRLPFWKQSQCRSRTLRTTTHVIHIWLKPRRHATGGWRWWWWLPVKTQKRRTGWEPNNMTVGEFSLTEKLENWKQNSGPESRLVGRDRRQSRAFWSRIRRVLTQGCHGVRKKTEETVLKERKQMHSDETHFQVFFSVEQHIVPDIYRRPLTAWQQRLYCRGGRWQNSTSFVQWFSEIGRAHV